MKNEDQLGRVLEPAEGEEPEYDDGITPLMPFPTSYVLDRDQEEELVNHALNRLEELEDETGRSQAAGGDWWSADATDYADAEDMQGARRTERSWMGKRVIYDLIYSNDVSHRSELLSGIFSESNLVVPVSRRITRQMVARATNYFFGTDPWFAVYPTGKLDRERADKADRYLKWKTDQSKVKRTLELGIERAFILGESVTKTSYQTRRQIYRTRATVLVDGMGADILGADGDYIMEQDLWIPQIVEDPATGEAVESDLFVLKRDGVTPQPEAMIWQEKTVTRRITHYNGPEAKVLNHLDFLCPLDAVSVQEADCCAHLYDAPVMELADQWKKAIAENADAAEQLEATRKAVSLLRKLASHGGERKTGQSAGSGDNQADKDTNRAGERVAPTAEIAEFYLRYDADGDGILEDVMLVVDRKSRTPIFYDYTANVTPDGLRPFCVTRVNEVPNRWYGIGAMEMFESSQMIVDLMVNRWNFGNSRAARIDFWNPANTLEGRATPDLEVNWGGTYTPAPGKTAKDCLESIYLENNTGEILREFTEFFMQLMMNESGVSSANDNRMVGMDSTKLATGIRNIEKSGQELFSLHIGHIEPGVSEILSKTVKLIFANLDPTETYRYFEEGEEGGEGSGEIREINAGDLSNIEIDIRILLTRFRGEQILESSIRAWETVEKYFDPTKGSEFQERVAPMAIDILKALQIQNAKDIIRPLTLPMPGQNPAPMPNADAMAQAGATRDRRSEPNL